MFVDNLNHLKKHQGNELGLQKNNIFSVMIDTDGLRVRKLSL